MRVYLRSRRRVYHIYVGQLQVQTTCKKHCELAAITKGENHIEQKELRKTGLECDILWAAVIPRLESGLGLERLQHLRPGISSSLLL